MLAVEPGEPAWPDDAVEVGRIIDAYGIKGWIKVQPYSQDPQALFSSRRWFLKPAAGSLLPPGRASQLPRLLRITQAKDHGELVVASAQEISDRNAAESLRGMAIYVSRGSFPTAGDDEYYWVDLIGLEVVNREGQSLGTVVGLLDTGPHSVLRIAPAEPEAEERLVPFVAAYVDEVRLAERRIQVDWGLDY